LKSYEETKELINQNIPNSNLLLDKNTGRDKFVKIMSDEIPLPTSIQNLLQEEEKAKRAEAQIEDLKRGAEQLLKQEIGWLRQRARNILDKYGNMKSVEVNNGQGWLHVGVEGCVETPAVKFKNKNKTYSLWLTEKTSRMGGYPKIDHGGAFIKICDLSKKEGSPNTLLSFPSDGEESKILNQPITLSNVGKVPELFTGIEKAFQEHIAPGQFEELREQLRKKGL
jgi:hypothetical protein